MPCCLGSFSVVRPARDLRAAADRPLVRPCLPVAWSTRPAAEGRRSLGLRQLRRRVIGHVAGVMELAIDSYRSRARPIHRETKLYLDPLGSGPRGGGGSNALCPTSVFNIDLARRPLFVRHSNTAEGKAREIPLTGPLFLLAEGAVKLTRNARTL